jgi:hypothetical protein
MPTAAGTMDLLQQLPCLKEPFAVYLRGLGDEGAMQALAHLEKIP